MKYGTVGFAAVGLVIAVNVALVMGAVQTEKKREEVLKTAEALLQRAMDRPWPKEAPKMVKYELKSEQGDLGHGVVRDMFRVAAILVGEQVTNMAKMPNGAYVMETTNGTFTFWSKRDANLSSK